MDTRRTLVITFACSMTLLVCSVFQSRAGIGFAEDTQAGYVETPVTDEDRQHWSFKPLVRPAIPDVKTHEWVRTPIDAFVLAAIEAAGTTPSAQADHDTLRRRLYFDLVGQPAAPDELILWSDCAVDSEGFGDELNYVQTVERLLASPAYGERWGQHWLDLARFAQTDGFEHDRVRPNAWKYRDWVLDALNEDLPYDRFVAYQLAGDLLEGGLNKVATTFCLAGPDMPDVNDQLERRHNMLNELTATVGSVFLGLQFGCAQCHDHKYDPVSQADFYRLRAVFENSVPELQRDAPYNSLSIQTTYPAPKFWARGDHRQPGALVKPALPRIADPANFSSLMREPAQARPALAAWITDASNPLSARVIVNRVWQYHFGRGLFSDASDAGLISADPTHPELLDWLACEFRDSGWSLKRLHRMIVSSATYRQSSRRHAGDKHWEQRITTDPQNRLYSRFSRKRLEGESLRDAMLVVSGLVNHQRGGKGVMPPLPEEMLSTLLKGQWSTSTEKSDHYRRSIYIFARRNLRYPLFDAFDRPDANASCPQRSQSTTALQSLQMINSEFSLIAAQEFARRLLTLGKSEPIGPRRELWIRAAIRGAYMRSANSGDISILNTFLSQVPTGAPQNVDSAMLNIDPQREFAKLTDLCLALLNANEFLYVD